MGKNINEMLEQPAIQEKCCVCGDQILECNAKKCIKCKQYFCSFCESVKEGFCQTCYEESRKKYGL